MKSALRNFRKKLQGECSSPYLLYIVYHKFRRMLKFHGGKNFDRSRRKGGKRRQEESSKRRNKKRKSEKRIQKEARKFIPRSIFPPILLYHESREMSNFHKPSARVDKRREGKKVKIWKRAKISRVFSRVFSRRWWLTTSSGAT